MNIPIQEWRLLSGLAFLALGACTAIEHGRELQEAQRRMDDATGHRPAWQVDMPVSELVVPAEGVLTQDAAIDLALTNNRALRADLEAIGQAKAELVQAGLLSNPMLTLMLRFPEAGGRPSLDFGLVKDFADLWLIPSRKRAAQSMLQQKLLTFTDGAVALVREVRTTYAALQYLGSAIEFQRENLEILKQAIDIAQMRLRSGGASQLDVNLLEARRLESQLALLQLENERQAARHSLLRWMGVSNARVDWRSTPISNEPISADLEEDALVNWGLERRLDIQAAGWEVDAALAEFQQQKLRLIQSLGIGVSGERFERRGNPGRNIAADTLRASIANGRLTAPEIEPRSARRAARRQEIDLVLGPSLEVPLPIFDQNQAQIAKAQFRARELHERYCELEQRTVEGIRTAQAARRIASQRMKLYQESLLPVQQSNLEVAEGAYQAGTQSVVTVLLAQEALVQTRLGQAAAARDLAISTANLERELGGRAPRADELVALEEKRSAARPPPPTADSDSNNETGGKP